MKIKVIIADDHQLIREGFKSLMNELEEVEVVGEAADGLQVINLLKSGKNPDIVLMDVEMPNMNGIETTEQITKDFLGVKVIMLTMVNDKQMIQDAVAKGAKGFLFKDTTVNSLYEAVRQVQAGKTYFGSEVALTLMNSGKETKAAVANLSKREIEVLKLIAEGFTSPEIGEKLFISPRTVDTHRNSLINKLDVNGIAGLIRFAISNKLA